MVRPRPLQLDPVHLPFQSRSPRGHLVLDSKCTVSSHCLCQHLALRLVLDPCATTPLSSRNAPPDKQTNGDGCAENNTDADSGLCI